MRACAKACTGIAWLRARPEWQRRKTHQNGQSHNYYSVKYPPQGLFFGEEISLDLFSGK